jgi:hypothetical protein
MEQIAKILGSVNGNTGVLPPNQESWNTSQVLTRESCEDMFEGATIRFVKFWRAACRETSVAAAAKAAVRSPRMEIEITGAELRPWAATDLLTAAELLAKTGRSCARCNLAARSVQSLDALPPDTPASELPTCAEEEGDEREERVHAAEDEASDEDAGSLQAPPRPGNP